MRIEQIHFTYNGITMYNIDLAHVIEYDEIIIDTLLHHSRKASNDKITLSCMRKLEILCA